MRLPETIEGRVPACLQEHPKKKQEELNGKGDPRKGGRVPQNANMKQQVPVKAMATLAPQ